MTDREGFETGELDSRAFFRGVVLLALLTVLSLAGKKLGYFSPEVPSSPGLSRANEWGFGVIVVAPPRQAPASRN